MFASHVAMHIANSVDNCIPYSGYNLRGAISANHQVSLLEVIFAIVKFANHSMVCMARLIYTPSAY